MSPIQLGDPGREQDRGGGLRPAGLILAVHHRRDLERQRPLGLAPLGLAAVASSSSSMRSRGKNVKRRRNEPTSASPVRSQNWKKAYGLVRARSSHTLPDSVLPNLVPSALMTNGDVSP